MRTIIRFWVAGVALLGVCAGCTGAAVVTDAGAVPPDASTGFDAGTADAGRVDGGGGDAGGADAGRVDAGGADGGASDGGSCLTFVAQATQAPAGLVITLDRSASMSLENAWTRTTAGLLQALDTDGFDGLSLGVVAYPSSDVPGPACVGVAINVSCGLVGTPQIPLQNARTAKSTDAQGVRHDIRQLLSTLTPNTADNSDSSPTYDALSASYAALTDGGFSRAAVAVLLNGGGSCASVSSPPRAGGLNDGSGCADWDSPSVVNSLLRQQSGASPSLQTFFVGLPGSASDGGMAGSYPTAPYSMQLALSTYAVSGSPLTVPVTCDKTAVWTQPGPPPAAACHFDLSDAAAGSPAAIASALQVSRKRAFGCLYDLPPPPSGQTLDPAKVNVVLIADSARISMPRRANAADACATNPCWDYDAQGRVNILGAGCDALSAAKTVTVELDVGCATVTR